MASTAMTRTLAAALLAWAALAICGCGPAAPKTRDVTPQPRLVYASHVPRSGVPIGAQTGSCDATRVWPTPLPADPRTPQPPLEWAILTPSARQGNDLLATADDGTILELQLCDMAVSDCRRDCYQADVEANLAPLTQADNLCIVYSAGQGAERFGTVWKLWVDRYECRDSGRVTPP